MSKEVDLWGKEIPRCQQTVNYPYVQCDCPVHDFVAELLNIDSTRVDGYKSTKTVQEKALEKYVSSKYAEPASWVSMDYIGGPPPRPRKPKAIPVGDTDPVPVVADPKLISYTNVTARQERKLREKAANRIAHNKAIVDDAIERGTKIYELGDWEDGYDDYRLEVKESPTLVWDKELATWVDGRGGNFIIEAKVNEATSIIYRRGNKAIRRNFVSMDKDAMVVIMKQMILEMDIAINEADAVNNQKLWNQHVGSRKPPPNPGRSSLR